MSVTRERLEQGMTYEQAKERMTRNREHMDRLEGKIRLTQEDLAPWRSLDEHFDVLVLVIDPCPDVQMNVPIMQRIATETGSLTLHVFMRDENKDLMAQFMNGRFESVPVFAFFDGQMRLRSVYIERPKSVTELRAEKTREIQEANPEFGPVGRTAAEMPEDIRARFQAAVYEMRAAMEEFYMSESIREFREIPDDLSRADSPASWRGNLVGAVPA